MDRDGEQISSGGKRSGARSVSPPGDVIQAVSAVVAVAGEGGRHPEDFFADLSASTAMGQSPGDRRLEPTSQIDVVDEEVQLRAASLPKALVAAGPEPQLS